MPQHRAAAVPRGAALCIAGIQFLFVSTWTLYVIYLPRLLQAAGLPPAWAPWLLMLDQFVFMLADVATGLWADRVQRALGRFGPAMAGVTALSCAAFALLPHARVAGPAAPALALGLMLVWTITSSALRAPPWVLLGKHAARPALPWLNALTLAGLAAAGALAPFLGVGLKNVDAALPFALASVALLASTGALVFVERHLARAGTAVAPLATTEPAPPRWRARHAAWALGVLLLAAGFQTHTALNAAPQYLRFAAPAELEWLLPLFWVGFGVGMLPAGAACKRFGALPLGAAAAWLGAVAAAAAAQAPSLATLAGCQTLAGVAWGGMLVAGFTAAADFGRTGREGLALGSLFAVLALATLGRIAAVLAGVPKQPALAPLLAALPVLLWAGGGVLLAALARGEASTAAATLAR